MFGYFQLFAQITLHMFERKQFIFGLKEIKFALASYTCSMHVEQSSNKITMGGFHTVILINK